jgi:DNA-binding transcriptional LysR family regulator
MGEELMHYSHKMHETAAAIDRWHNGFSNDNKVKISAGGWTAWFLTTHIEEISELTPNFKLELISDVGYVDILRREANIGIRNKPSKQAGLDNTKLNSVNFAIYTHCKTDTPYYEPNKAKELSKQNWIGSSLETPSALWLKKNIDANFVFSSSNVHLILEAAERGLGLCILPCFVGDTRAKLKCVSKPITSLRHDQWLVSHSEDHHFPAIRNTMNSLVQIWSKNKNCLA